MVRNKMEQREYIILCLEDSNDWSNATSRRLVMQVCAVPVQNAMLYLMECQTISETMPPPAEWW